MTTTQERLVLAAVDAESASLRSVSAALVELVRAIWRAIMLNPYDHGQVDKYVHTVGPAVVQARRTAAGISDAYMRRVLDVMEIPNAPNASRRPEPIPDLPRGIPLTSEWARPVKEYRRARLLGLDDLQAHQRAERRQAVMARMDVLTAARDARQARLALVSDQIGWRRVIHPEMSATGTVCGLCLAAADRVYRNIRKMELHEDCHCTLAPVTKTQDPGSPLNADTLGDLYNLAGGTDRGSLSRVRYTVYEHGELGPILTSATHEHRGPGDVAPDAPQLVENARVELGTLQQVIDELLAREKAGENVTDLLAWNRERATALHAMVAAA